MPTIQDIANQINNTLTQINQNTQDTANTLALVKGDTADLNTRVDTLDAHLTSRLDQLTALNQAGFLLLGQGLFAILEQFKKANSLLEGNVEQNKAIICLLSNATDLLCRILHRQNTQVSIQAEIEDDTDKLRRMMEIVHCAASSEVGRMDELTAKIERCCPPKPECREECPEPCKEPEVRPYEPDPETLDWCVPQDRKGDVSHRDDKAVRAKSSKKGGK